MAEAINLVMIALEITKMPSFSHFTVFLYRVKLVLLVLLVLVVVLEREENLVLRVMLDHLGLRYISNTWHLRGAVTCSSQSPSTPLFWSWVSSTGYSVIYFSRALLEELEALATRVKW